MVYEPSAAPVGLQRHIVRSLRDTYIPRSHSTADTGLLRCPFIVSAIFVLLPSRHPITSPTRYFLAERLRTARSCTVMSENKLKR